MNWVGGTRSRFMAKNDTRRQKDYFEKKRLLRKMNLLGLKKSNSNGNNSSMDLVTMFVVNQISANKQKKVLHSDSSHWAMEKKDLHQEQHTLLSSFSRRNSQDEHNSQFSFQYHNMDKRITDLESDGLNYKQLSPVLESSFSDGSGANYQHLTHGEGCYSSSIRFKVHENLPASTPWQSTCHKYKETQRKCEHTDTFSENGLELGNVVKEESTKFQETPEVDYYDISAHFGGAVKGYEEDLNGFCTLYCREEAENHNKTITFLDTETHQTQTICSAYNDPFLSSKFCGSKEKATSFIHDCCTRKSIFISKYTAPESFNNKECHDASNRHILNSEEKKEEINHQCFPSNIAFKSLNYENTVDGTDLTSFLIRDVSTQTESCLEVQGKSDKATQCNFRNDTLNIFLPSHMGNLKGNSEKPTTATREQTVQENGILDALSCTITSTLEENLETEYLCINDDCFKTEYANKQLESNSKNSGMAKSTTTLDIFQKQPVNNIRMYAMNADNTLTGNNKS